MRSAPCRELLVETIDQQQGEVDAQPEADHARGIQRKNRDVRLEREQIHDRQGEYDAGCPQHERDQRGDQGAEDDQQQDGRDGQRDELGPPQILLAYQAHVDVGRGLPRDIVLERDSGERRSLPTSSGFAVWKKLSMLRTPSMPASRRSASCTAFLKGGVSTVNVSDRNTITSVLRLAASNSRSMISAARVDSEPGT